MGVHAGATILSTEAHGLSRGEDQRIKGMEPLHYHAEAPPELVTLITPPIKYEYTEGLYTPAYQSWGYGLRYIEEIHVKNILARAYHGAIKALAAAGITERELVQRQITVLKNIRKKYALELTGDNTEQNSNGLQQTSSLPDNEIGYLGEKYIYERELEYVKSIGCKPQEVEWISQAVPTAPFDIRTIRLSPTGTREHFIEVKSSILSEVNVYVSSGQLSFFKAHEEISIFSIVRFDAERNVLSVQELTLPQLLSEFELVPIKYKLARRIE